VSRELKEDNIKLKKQLLKFVRIVQAYSSEETEDLKASEVYLYNSPKLTMFLDYFGKIKIIILVCFAWLFDLPHSKNGCNLQFECNISQRFFRFPHSTITKLVNCRRGSSERKRSNTN